MADALLPTDSAAERQLAGNGVAGGICDDPAAFLGVGNARCLHANLGTAVFLLGVIVVVSIGFDRLLRVARRGVQCPQLSKIVDRIFQEVMIMGFISMVIFTLNTSGALRRMNFAVDALSPAEQLHFYEFFHYLVFLTMIYFILIVLLLLFIGTVVPKLIWKKPRRRTLGVSDSDGDSDAHDDSLVAAFSDPDDDDNNDNDDNDDDGTSKCGDSRGADSDTFFDLTSASRHQPARASALRRAKSGMNLVQGSHAYRLLLERYEREGWGFRFNVRKQWHLWKSFEILAYNICQNRSGYIYKNPDEMERLFGVRAAAARRPLQNLLRPAPARAPMTYARYHVLCMRNLLVHITDLHFSALLILLVISVLPSLYPGYDHWIFVGVGATLLVANLVIFFKVLQILRGTVDDRLRVITTRDINAWAPHRTHAGDARRTPTLKAAALAVRAVIRMQMSALCHRQLHYHDDRFWFNSPKLLLRMFQFATISQAFYLVWFSLVEAPTLAHKPEALYLLPIMVLLPFLALCVITPMTMPSLVLVMSLTGIFVDLNTEPSSRANGALAPHDVAKVQIRLMRRSFLKSHYADADDATCGVRSPTSCAAAELDAACSPTNVFLRIYDSPTAAAAHTGLATADVASPTNSTNSQRGSAASGAGGSIGRSGASIGRNGLSGTNSVGRSGRDDIAYSPRRVFNLAAFQAHANPSAPGAVAFSPRGQGFAESTSAASAAPANWSQAAVQQVGAAAKKSTPSEAARTASGGEQGSNQTDALPNPAAESLKRYCSKYGGYPEC
ncbi:hypothetical protein PybrP1_006407 [[Pythium] brassicae (nom. inval.)]|nr:hypothetical protein PybrP1_006407 [[Pythium] brassicae (nom. inval.)]